MSLNPIELVGGLINTANVIKADLVAWVKGRVPQVLADATELRNTILAGQNVVKLKSTGVDYRLDTSDTTTSDDGVTCIVSADAFRFKALVASTTVSGIVELATDAEAMAMSDALRVLTPSNLAAVLAFDVQTFTASGVWTKPPVGRFALIQIVGAGGGGARRSAGNGSGGGPGGYVELLLPLSSLGSTETVTIGLGGAVQAVDNTVGWPGGLTSFGAHITMYGGRGGSHAAAGTLLMGGGSGYFSDIWTAGADNSSGLLQGAHVITTLAPYFCGLNGAAATGTLATNAVQTFPLVGYSGPAGGAGHCTTTAASGVANTSIKAGNGGAGNAAGPGGNGASPGGGGGSGTTQGGSGGNGRIIVTVF